MNRFIATRILLPIAQIGFLFATAGSLVLTTSAINQALAPKEDLNPVIKYSMNIYWKGMTGWLGTAALAQIFGGWQDEEEEETTTTFESEPETFSEYMSIQFEDYVQRLKDGERFDYWAEIDKHHDRLTKEKCSQCRFYCGDNEYLNCAVHPELLYSCKDFSPLN